MQSITETTTDALKDLIIINNDRFEGYQKGVEQTEDLDLKTLFTKYSLESKMYSSELRNLLPNSEEAPKRDETRISGKFYRAWMDIKNALASNDRKAVLSSCEYGEDVAKKAYEDTLKDRDSIRPEVTQLIQKQYDNILNAHNSIKSLRDSA